MKSLYHQHTYLSQPSLVQREDHLYKAEKEVVPNNTLVALRHQYDRNQYTRIESLQKLQNRAARIVTGSSYDAPSVPLRKELGWLSVKEMIVKETSTMMYKSLNDLAPQYLSDLFVRLSDFHTRELRNTKNDLAVPLMRTVSGQKAFSYRGTKVWNKFKNDIKEAPSVYSFKSRLRQLGYENL